MPRGGEQQKLLQVRKPLAIQQISLRGHENRVTKLLKGKTSIGNLSTTRANTKGINDLL